MNTTHRGARRQRSIAALAVASLVLTGTAVARSQHSASADTTDTQVVYSCPIVGALTVTETATDTPDPVTAGADMTLNFQGGVPTVPITVTLNNVVLEVPIPAQVASVNDVTFSGGNVAGTVSIGPDLVTLTFTGPVQSTAIQLPSTTFAVTVSGGTEGETINWPAPSKISTDVQFIGVLSCSADPTNPPMQTTAIEAAPEDTTTTVDTPTTTAIETTTTVDIPTTTTTIDGTSTTTTETTTAAREL